MTKNSHGDNYTWKDFNIGANLNLNGISFRIVDCDPFTRDFMLSEGVELLDPEMHLYNEMKQRQSKIGQGHVSAKGGKKIEQEDKLRRFLLYQGKVLR